MIPAHVYVQQHSKRARALAARLTKTIDDFRHEEPKVSDEEIRMAMLLVRPGDSIDRRRRIAIAATAIGMSLAVGIGVAVSAEQRGGIQMSTVLWPALAVVAVCAVAGVMVLIRLRDR